MFYSSVEFRYFYSIEPTEVLRWFEQHECIKSFKSRTDTYLVFPNSTSVGVKFREGRFEIKSFIKVVDELTALQLSVPVEAWEKWSSPDLFANVHLEGSQWVNVKKTRSLLTIIDGSPVEWKADRPAACNAEFSKVEALGQTYWTFNLESYGNGALSNLENGWKSILKPGLPLEFFNARHRMSYPEWLSSLSR